jgi:hypothetical protein
MSYSFDNEFVSVQVAEIVEDFTVGTGAKGAEAGAEAGAKAGAEAKYNPIVPNAPTPVPVLPKLRLRGSFKSPSSFSKIECLAAAPIDRFMNYSGSGLPFACANMAFENTPNYYLFRPEETFGGFDITFVYPNRYYTADHTTLVAPSIFFGFTPISGNSPTYVRFELPTPESLSLKSLGHRPERKGPEFYSAKADIIGVPINQETYLRSIGSIKSKYGVA